MRISKDSGTIPADLAGQIFILRSSCMAYAHVVPAFATARAGVVFFIYTRFSHRLIARSGPPTVLRRGFKKPYRRFGTRFCIATDLMRPVSGVMQGVMVSGYHHAVGGFTRR